MARTAFATDLATSLWIEKNISSRQLAIVGLCPELGVDQSSQTAFRLRAVRLVARLLAAKINRAVAHLS